MYCKKCQTVKKPRNQMRKHSHSIRDILTVRITLTLFSRLAILYLHFIDLFCILLVSHRVSVTALCAWHGCLEDSKLWSAYGTVACYCLLALVGIKGQWSTNHNCNEPPFSFGLYNLYNHCMWVYGYPHLSASAKGLPLEVESSVK